MNLYPANLLARSLSQSRHSASVWLLLRRFARSSVLPLSLTLPHQGGGNHAAPHPLPKIRDSIYEMEHLANAGQVLPADSSAGEGEVIESDGPTSGGPRDHMPMTGIEIEQLALIKTYIGR